MAVAIALYTTACLVGGSYGHAFFAIPAFVGFVAGATCPARPYVSALVALSVALVASVLTLREGVICVLFSLPVLVPMLLLGAFTGSALVLRIRNGAARRGAIGTVVLFGLGWQVVAGLADDPRQHPLHSAETALAIDAPPEAVFESLVAGDLALAPRWPWFIRIGLPMPQRMVVDKAGPEGELRFEFSQGTAFARVTNWKPPHVLAYHVDRYVIRDRPFHSTRLGRSPDYGLRAERIQDWLTIEDTRFEIRRAAEGGSVLRRRVVWRRHLAPDLYFGWLQQKVIERGQQRLLDLIAERTRSSSTQDALIASAFHRGGDGARSQRQPARSDR